LNVVDVTTNAAAGTRSRHDAAALAIAAAGALLATIACFLPWIRLELGRLPVFVAGTDRTITASAADLGTTGLLAVLAAIVMLLCAAALLAGTRPPIRTVCAIALAVAGLAVVAVAVFAVATKGARADQVLRAAWQASVGRSLPPAEFERLRAVLARLGSGSTTGAGVYLAMLGGALAAAGGAMATVASLAMARSARADRAAGGFDVGWSAERPG
jgi:hypothetical protein